MVEDRKRILKLIEDGKITAEEAIILLEKLEKVEISPSEKYQKSEQEEIVQELSTVVDFENHQNHKREQKSQKQASAKTKFIDFIDSALKKIKDLDLDFNFGNATEVHHIFFHSNVDINQIELDVANGSIKLVPWDEKDVRIECDGKVYKVESQDEARNTFLQDVLFSIEGGKLTFSVQKKQMKVNSILYIPQTEYEKVKVRTFNGPISGEKLHVTEFKAKTANGSIDINQFRSTEIELETANGHIKAKDCRSTALDAETINGTLDVRGSFGKVDLQSFNGNVICSLADYLSHTAHIKTTTGNIDLYVSGILAIDGELKSNLGGFKCEVPNMDIVEEKSEVVQKLLRFKANSDQSNRLHIFAETKTGSILVKPEGGVNN
ncbi:DUF4097 domain-containing protein [Cytobacillus sp. S13-E01]|uniref:DUF4097 family beta strand repeat-containing protein n=1 Tax=Cytobacillus sp. S13-E01 TaxID=3031326 RepID=UPI0023D877C5|nr:DUF4097 domain-containing protein [Cytobacillus sp. S13-E01]MDF0728279.1 DUF4097 domain-containing protein [Cytobacillus sp. S13-E01]